MSSVVQPRPLPARTYFAAAEALLSFAGAGIAGTIWRADQAGQDLPCSAGGGCGIVAASAWSHVDLIFFHQIPVALLGLAGYVLLLTLAMLRLGSDNARLNQRLYQLIGLVSAGGAAYSWYLQWIAAVKIGAYCPWCRASALLMTVLFCTAATEGLARRRNAQTQEIHR